MSRIPAITYLYEHGGFNDSDRELIRRLDIPFCEPGYECAPKYLGIHPTTLCAGYYIGAEWLTDDHAVVVMPKIRDLDFVEMFVSALRFESSAKYFDKFYDIDFNAQPIRTNAFNNQITPLLIIHFIAILKRITKRGLKKAYVMKCENLQSKVKGKIHISRHIKQNIIPRREERIYCKYQDYTVDNPENRVLKKALTFSESYLSSLAAHKSYATLTSVINNVKSHFHEVADTFDTRELKSIVKNDLYKDYSEALRIAKMILRKFSYSISETRHDIDFTPPFWIDMSRLYEVYVYSKLYERFGDAIKFQVPGHHRTAVDFVDTANKVIIDTKYKPRYNDGNCGIIDDIRQISAYARDRKILKVLGCDSSTTVDCLIIYPEKVIEPTDTTDQETEAAQDSCPQLSSFTHIGSLLQHATPINGYERFYKLSFRMPYIRPQS